MKKTKAVWELLYCYNGMEYRPLKTFKTTPKRTGGVAAEEYCKKLLTTPKYKGKEDLLWVERYTGPDTVSIWM